jgi:hypothetical protein
MRWAAEAESVVVGMRAAKAGGDRGGAKLNYEGRNEEGQEKRRNETVCCVLLTLHSAII